MLKKIAEFYEVNVTELMDEYNLFLCHKQNLQLKRLINDFQLTPKAVAKKLNVHAKTVAAWESEKVRMSKRVLLKSDIQWKTKTWIKNLNARNDNSWQPVTAENIGAATEEQGQKADYAIQGIKSTVCTFLLT